MSETENPAPNIRPKRTAKPDVGAKFEVAVATLVAAILSNNKHIENYYVFTNLKEALPFDDVVAKVFFKGENSPYAFAMQLKHIGKGETLNVEKYLKGYNKICHAGGFKTIGNIAVDNIQFSYFCIKDVKLEAEYEEKAHQPNSESWRSAVSFENCHTLLCKKPVNETDKRLKNFLDKFHLHFDQTDSKIEEKTKSLCKINNTTDILTYIDRFLEKDVLWRDGLGKQIFETELLKIRLSDNIVPPTNITHLNDIPVAIWNRLVLQHNVTIVQNEINIEKSLYGCLAKMVNHLLNNVVNWNECKSGTIDSIVIDEFKQLFTTDNSGRSRHWIDAPKTLKSLLIELWKCGEVPLILKSDEELSVLKDFAHLNKSYIVITDHLVSRREEIGRFPLRVFTHISDLEPAEWLEMRDQLLKAIVISLHGRKPITLYAVIKRHEELTATLQCSHILHLMKTRRVYLSKRCLDCDYNIIFLIEDPTSASEYNNESIDKIGYNTAIRCRTTEVTKLRKQIEEHPKFQSYTICHCVVTSENENFTLIEGNESILCDFFVDQYGESIYNLENNVAPILGGNFGNIQESYISRSICSAVISTSIFESSTKGIFFFSGDLSALDETMRKHIKKVPLDRIHESIQPSNENTFISVESSDIDKYWTEASTQTYPLLYICVEGIVLKLCKYKGWKGLHDHISYGSANISEESFLMGIADGITVLTGEPGIGKTSLLRSLFKNHSKEHYILFYNLVDYKADKKSELLPSNFALDFISNKFRDTRYKEFLSVLFKKTKRLVVLLDSFDEALPSQKEETLNFIRNLAASNVKIIIGSRLLANYILMHTFEAQVFKVDILTAEDCKKYTQNSTLSKELLITTPPELLRNPLYLNFLKIISANKIDMAHISKLALFESIINIKLNQYFERYFSGNHISDKEHHLKYVRKLHLKLALVRVLGVDVIEKLLKWKYKKDLPNQLKLGIVLSTDEEGYPTFVHETFAEYLTADWIIRNRQKDCAKNVYQEILNQDKLYVLDILCEHLELHRAVIERNTEQLQMYASDRSHLEKTDILGRTAIHVASAYSNFFNDKIIGIIVHNMYKFEIGFNSSDYLMQWNWIQHLNKGNVIYFMPWTGFSTLVMKAYLNNIVQKLCDGSMKFLNGYYLSSVLYNTRVRAMETFSIDMVRDLWFLEDAMSNGISRAVLHRECQALEEDSLNLEKISRCTPLHIACINGNLKVVRKLINRKHDINACDDFGCLPLHYSVISLPGEAMAITQILLENGSKVDIVNKMKETPIDMAVRSGILDIVELLLQNFSINMIGINRQKLLFLALERRDRNMVMLLLRYGADVNSVSEDGTSALQFLCYTQNYDFELVKLLLSKGANVNHADESGRTALLLAVEKGNVDGAKILLEHSANVNSSTKEGNTPLMIAIKMDHFHVVELLLERGANINTITAEGITPLMCAFEMGNLNVIQLLQRKETNVNNITIHGKTLLMFASQSGNVEIVKLALAQDAKVNSRTSEGKTPLMFASENGNLDVVQLLLERGANINSTTTDGETALMYTTRCNRSQVVKLLLENGANVNSATTEGKTPLIFASENGNLDVVQLLLERGANINSATTNGKTALMFTIRWNRSQVVKLLLENGANVNSATTEGKTPLMLVCQGDSNVAELLLEKGANINSTTIDGITPLMFASLYSNAFALKVLLENGANVNSTTANGETSLIFAVEWGNLDVVELLLQNGANVNSATTKGETSLTLAAAKGNSDIVKLLLRKGADVDHKTTEDKTPLMLGSRSSVVVKLLLDKGANVNSTTAEGKTPLMFAIDADNSNVVELLLEKGASLNCTTTEGITPLMLSAKLYYPNIVHLLLEKGADINSATSEGKTPLMFASETGSSHVVTFLLERGADFNGETIRGKTSLMFASEMGHLYVVKLLLAKNANINSATTEGKTPLMYASEKSHSDVVKLLLQKGANINSTTL